MSETDRIKDIISDYTGCAVSDIEDSTTLRGDLGLDSLDRFEILMALEDEFEIRLQDSDSNNWETVEDLAKTVAWKS